MNRKASVFILSLGAFGLLSILFVVGKGEGRGNESNTMNEENEGKKEEILLLILNETKWIRKKRKATIKSIEKNK